MKHVLRIVAIVLVLSLLFVLTACSDKKDKLLGTWKFTETGEKITFKSDGTFLWEESGESLPGKYVLDGDSLTLDFGGGDKDTFQIESLDGSKLVLSLHGETLHFEKQ